jgi:hypothetical protein
LAIMRSIGQKDRPQPGVARLQQPALAARLPASADLRDQAGAHRPGLVDYLGDRASDREQPLDQDLRPGGPDPGGPEAAGVAVEGEAARRLVDVDAHVGSSRRRGLVGRAGDLEASRLGGRLGQDLRSETRESPTPVCAPDGYSAFILSLGTPSWLA